MSIIQALILGMVQGVTEFLPVSSSGHLVILEHIWKISQETGIFFHVLVHLGTLAAVLAAFGQDIKKLAIEGCRSVRDLYGNIRIYFHNKRLQDAKRYKKMISNNYRKLFLLLLVSTIPTAVEGLFLRSFAQQAENNMIATGIGFFITGILLLVVEVLPTGQKIPKEISYKEALFIGFCQGLAVFPGISRLGITLTACLLCGFSRRFAMRYSFLIAIPTILGSALLEAVHLPDVGLTLELFGTYLLAALAAGLAGFLCIQGMLSWVRRGKFRFFSVYCFLAGITVVAMNFVK